MIDLSAWILGGFERHDNQSSAQPSQEHTEEKEQARETTSILL